MNGKGERTALLSTDTNNQNGHAIINNYTSENAADAPDYEESSVISDISAISRHSIQSDLPSHAIDLLPGMQIRCHAISKTGGIQLCTQEEALTGAKAGGKKHYWIDIDAHRHHATELKNWLRGIHLPNFVCEVLAEPPENWASQIIPLHRACLAVIRILPAQVDSDEMAHLAALNLRNMLITFTSCQKSSNSVNSAKNDYDSLYDKTEQGTATTADTDGLYYLALERMKQPERLPLPTSSGALLAWLRFHVDRASEAIRELRYNVLTMDESMDRDIDSVQLAEIIQAKDQLLRLLSVAEEQSACLESLAAAETEGLDFSSLKGSLSILLATTKANERHTLRLEKHLTDLRQRHEGHDHHMMNRRLAVLTVLSAVFLPLTLFTGIWGMNFDDMPELKKPYAYPLALLFMVSVAAIMILCFRRKGYFR